MDFNSRGTAEEQDDMVETYVLAGVHTSYLPKGRTMTARVHIWHQVFGLAIQFRVLSTTPMAARLYASQTRMQAAHHPSSFVFIHCSVAIYPSHSIPLLFSMPSNLYCFSDNSQSLEMLCSAQWYPFGKRISVRRQEVKKTGRPSRKIR